MVLLYMKKKINQVSTCKQVWAYLARKWIKFKYVILFNNEFELDSYLK